jgi:hypothetical protein
MKRAPSNIQLPAADYDLDPATYRDLTPDIDQDSNVSSPRQQPSANDSQYLSLSSASSNRIRQLESELTQQRREYQMLHER